MADVQKSSSSAVGLPVSEQQSENIELRSVSVENQTPSDSEQARREEAAELHPVDRGFHAWLFVASSACLELLVWGFPFCFGIFQDWYLTHEFKDASEASINAVGTVTMGVQYIEGFAALFFARRYARYLPRMMRVTLGVCVISMFASSFSTEVWHLILLQGVVYGAAGGFLYTPYIFWLPEWFSKRRSLAGSLIFGGMSLGGAIFPLIMTSLLERVGFRWTLRIWSAMLLVCGACCIPGIKPRIPVSRMAELGPLAPFDLGFVRNPVFLSMMATILIQGLGLFCVSLYIPSYATTLGLSRIDGTIALSIFNFTSVIGQILFGLYCENRPYTGAIAFSGAITSILAFALWGFAHDLTRVFLFTIAFATMSAALMATWLPAATEIAASNGSNRPASDIIISFGTIKGLAAIIGPLIAAALHPKKSNGAMLSAGKGGWGGYGFTGITVFVGGAMALTGVMGLVLQVLRARVGVRSSA